MVAATSVGVLLLPFCCLAKSPLLRSDGQPCCFYNEAREGRARGRVPIASISTHPRKFGNHMTVHRPSVRTSGEPIFYLALSSKFGSSGAT